MVKKKAPADRDAAKQFIKDEEPKASDILKKHVKLNLYRTAM
jgi:hypothetical protein